MSSDSSNSSNNSTGEGNTKTSPVRQISPAKRWCFTFNNYSDSDISSIVPIFRDKCSKVIIGKEVGESGTPHLQGFCSFKVKCRPLSLKLPAKIHWEKAKGNDVQNFEYCSKNSNILLNIGFPKPPNTISKNNFKSWQRELTEIFEVPAAWDDRTIYWYYGDANIGKTQWAKYMCVHHNAVVIGGHKRHMLAQVEKSEAPIYIVLLSYGDNKVSYRALEQIKDGLFTSHFGCDNNNMVIRDAPHLVIIGNEPPNEDDPCFHPGKYIVKKI